MADVTVIGGGVIGLSIAEELARTGAQVRVIDRTAFGQEASWAGAGMLPPGPKRHSAAFSALPAEAQLRGFSNELWPDLSARLQDATGIDNDYHVNGALYLFGGEQDRQNAISQAAAEDVPTEVISAADAEGLEPALDAGGKFLLRLPTQAQVRNPRHLKALLAVCEQLGVELIPDCTALGWQRQGDRLTGLETRQGRFHSDRYVVATGAFGGLLLDELDIRLPVVPVRGQIVLLNFLPKRIWHTIEEGPRYLVPRKDGRVIVGSTEEHAGFLKQTTPAGIESLLQLVQRLCPSTSDAAVERTWAGLRPYSADGLPYLGRIEPFEQLYVATGHFRSGLQMSVGTAVLMRQLILGEPTDISLAPFSPQRVPQEQTPPEQSGESRLSAV